MHILRWCSTYVYIFRLFQAVVKNYMGEGTKLRLHVDGQTGWKSIYPPPPKRSFFFGGGGINIFLSLLVLTGREKGDVCIYFSDSVIMFYFIRHLYIWKYSLNGIDISSITSFISNQLLNFLHK